MISIRVISIAAAGLFLGGVVSAVLVAATLRHSDGLPASTAPPKWTEMPWPFPLDQFGRGKAFQCEARDCGAPVRLYVRAKIGFCNCATGVADDEELERIGDLDLLSDKVTARGAGRPIAVAWMKGRSRSYSFSERPGRSALSIGYNDRCDAIVATAVMHVDHPDNIESTVIRFLNAPTVMQWIEKTLGL
jgi:hypothetical protein